MRKFTLLLAAAVAAMTSLGWSAARAQQSDEALKATFERVAKLAQEAVDTTRFKKKPPYHIGVSAGYLSNSWILFLNQYVKYEASLHPEFADVVVTDAAFNPAKQASDVEDLLSKGIDVLLFWPVDEKAMMPALEKVAAKGIPTVNIGYNFIDSPAVTSNAYVDQWKQSTQVATHLAESLKDKGTIFAMLPIAGSSAAVTQLAALNDSSRATPTSSSPASNTATGIAPRPSSSQKTCCSASRTSTACSRRRGRCRQACSKPSTRPAAWAR